MSTDDATKEGIGLYIGLDTHAYGTPKIDVCDGNALLRIWPAGVCGGPYFSLSPHSWDTLVAAVADARAEAVQA